MRFDYTYCDGQGCPIRTKCKRYILKPTEGDYFWFADPMWDDTLLRCECYDGTKAIRDGMIFRQ